jgi:ferric-dicitrate binding protein FerR (iron transport regulator)
VATRAGQAFEAWRDADQAARAAEQSLQRKWDDYSLGQGGPPTRELIRDVTQLRAKAHEKLTLAIAVVDDEVELQRHPKPAPRPDRPSSR